MKSMHDYDDVLAACREVMDREGAEGFRREAVRAALQDRARRAGSEPVGVKNETLSAAMQQVREERRDARAAAHAASAAAEGSGVLDGLSALLDRCVSEIEVACRRAVAEERQRGVIEMRQRVQAVEEEAAGQRAVLETDLLLVQRECDGLATELDQARDAIADLESQVARLTAGEAASRGREAELSKALADRTAELTALHAASSDRALALEDALRSARDGHLAAERRASKAELSAAEAVTTLSRLEERHAVLAAEREQWRETAARHDARAAEAERDRDEGRGRIAAAEAECARLRAELASGGTAMAGAVLPTKGQTDRRRSRPLQPHGR